MIYFLSGTLISKDNSFVIIEASGVGYGVDILPEAVAKLPELEQKVSLWIYTKVREDELKLFGFVEKKQRQVFEILLDISGIGPKVAQAILASLDLFSLWDVILNKDAKRLEMVPGVGKRTAEKMVLELEARSKKLQVIIGENSHSLSTKSDLGSSIKSQHQQIFSDLRSALLNLGYKEKDISNAVFSLRKEYQEETLEELIKKSFSLLSQRQTNAAKSKDILTKIF